MRHSAGEAPSLSPPSLADAAADTVDHSSLAFLLKVALQMKKDEEEKEARKVETEQVQAVKEEWRARRKVLQGEFSALLGLESRSSLQERRLQELLDALDAHDAFLRFLEEEEEAASSSNFFILLSWPRSSSTTAVACSCSSRCVPFFLWQAQMPGFWWPRSSLTLAAAYEGLVLLFSLLALCSHLSLSGPDARHHGWYEPEGQLHRAGFAGISLCAVFPSCCCLAPDARIMAGMAQRRVTSCRAENCRTSTVAVHQGRFSSCRYAEADPMVTQTIEIPQLLDKVVDVPVVQVVWFHWSFISPSWR